MGPRPGPGVFGPALSGPGLLAGPFQPELSEAFLKASLKRARHFLEFLFTLALGVAVRALNPRQAWALACFLGRLGHALGVAGRVTRENLERAFPDRSPAERRRIARGAMEHFMIGMFDILRMPLIDPRELVAQFEFEGLDVLDESLKRGKGGVCLSAHFGNWEWMGAALVARGYPLSFLIGTQSNPWVDRLFNSYRQHCDINLIPLKNVREVLSVLKRNQFIALLGDQDGDKWGLFTRFFGRTASTFQGAAVFARRTGADLLFGVPVRLGPEKHRMRILRLPEPPEGLSEEKDLLFRLQAYSDALEAAIRENPEQWWWMHKRWEARPEHRLVEAERARALQGEITFDLEEQAWKLAATGERFQPTPVKKGHD